MADPENIANHDEAAFHRDGYLVRRGVLARQQIDEIKEFIRASLDPLVGPAEFEADVGYPGSPPSRSAPGGETPRRLLHAYARSPLLQALARHPLVCEQLTRLIGSEPLLSQCHHNCVMTKHPGFSSATLWHQDIRYWRFDRPELISAWFALGEEYHHNGALLVIPGTHRHEFEPGRLDRGLFLRPELEENKALVEQAVPVELNAGDVILFHCRLFHAAGKNTTDNVKLSPVFTYHAADNHPIPDTRSAAFPSIQLSD